MADTASAAANGTGAVSAPATGNAGLYNPEEAGRKLLELDALVPQVAVALHQDKFKQVQAFLKKNNDLIQAVMARQAQALAQDQKQQAAPQGGEQGEGGEKEKALLQQCAEMIKELNDNLTQVYDIYAELSPAPKEE